MLTCGCNDQRNKVEGSDCVQKLQISHKHVNGRLCPDYSLVILWITEPLEYNCTTNTLEPTVPLHVVIIPRCSIIPWKSV